MYIPPIHEMVCLEEPADAVCAVSFPLIVTSHGCGNAGPSCCARSLNRTLVSNTLAGLVLVSTGAALMASRSLDFGSSGGGRLDGIAS